MVAPALMLVLGLTLLIIGADWLVRGASALAKKWNMSDLAIGLTIVAFGTSAPELVVNAIASFQNHHDLVFGNIIGSNNFNLFIILGISGLITPIVVKSSTVWKEIPLSFFAAVMLFLLANDVFQPDKQLLSRTDGLLLFALFLLFLFYVYKQLKQDPADPSIKPATLSNLKTWFFILFGLAGLIGGGKLIVTNAIHIASTLGVSEKIIGVTIVAAGTSLPELATSLVAAIKKNNDIAVGNIIGSNIFNIFLILSVSSFIKPIHYDPRFNPDLYMLAAGTIFLFMAMFTGGKRKMDRWEAVILLTSYIGFTLYLIGSEI